MPRHNPTSNLQDVGQSLSDAANFANIVDATAETFGASPEVRRDLKKSLFIGLLVVGGLYLLTKKK